MKKLGIEDFRHITKEKVINLASMLDKMDPEVAKKALEQFPDFAATSKEILIDYKETIDKGIESNDKSVQNVYTTYNQIIESLRKELDKGNLSFEEKKYIINQMKEISDKVDKKDTENKKWIATMAAIFGVVALGTVAFLSQALGGNTNITGIDLSDDEK